MGNTAFIESIKEVHVRGRWEEGIPALRQMKPRSRPDEIMQHIKIILAGNEKLAWQLGVYLSHRYSGMKLKEIGEIFGMRESAICEATRRIRARIERDSVLRQQVETIKEGLKT